MSITRQFLCEAGQLISMDDYYNKFVEDLHKALSKKMPSRLQLKIGKFTKSSVNRYIGFDGETGGDIPVDGYIIVMFAHPSHNDITVSIKRNGASGDTDLKFNASDGVDVDKVAKALIDITQYGM